MVFLAKHSLVDKFNLSCLEAIYSGAAPLSLDIQNEVIKRISKGKRLPVLQGYGMTEIGLVTLYRRIVLKNYMSNSIGNLMGGMSAKVSCILYVINYVIIL